VEGTGVGALVVCAVGGAVVGAVVGALVVGALVVGAEVGVVLDGVLTNIALLNWIGGVFPSQAVWLRFAFRSAVNAACWT